MNGKKAPPSGVDQILEVMVTEAKSDLNYFLRMVLENIDDRKGHSPELQQLLAEGKIDDILLGHLKIIDDWDLETMLYAYSIVLEIMRLVKPNCTFKNSYAYFESSKNFQDEYDFLGLQCSKIDFFNQLKANPQTLDLLLNQFQAFWNQWPTSNPLQTNGKRFPLLPACKEEELTQAKNGQRDYYTEDEGVGIAEIKGRRLAQEDRLSYTQDPALINSLAQLSDEELKAFILEVWFPSLHERCDRDQSERVSPDHSLFRIKKSPGSCFLAFFILPSPEGNRLVSISLGDSVLFLHQANGQLRWINKYLHSMRNPYEYARVQNTKRVRSPRLGGRLAISGAFGDQEMRSFGLEQQPQIVIHRLNEGDSVIAGCDGLTEPGSLRIDETMKNPSAPQALQKLVKNPVYLSFTRAQQAIFLCMYSYFSGSEDNISTMLTAKPGVYGLFDGHSGSVVSQLLQSTFVPSLDSALKRFMQKKDDTTIRPS